MSVTPSSETGVIALERSEAVKNNALLVEAALVVDTIVSMVETGMTLRQEVITTTSDIHNTEGASHWHSSTMIDLGVTDTTGSVRLTK